MPSGMLASIHHHEAGIPQVCFTITKRTARMRTQLTSKRLSSQRFLHLGITHLPMQKVYSFAAPFNSSHTETEKLKVTHYKICSSRAQRQVRTGRFDYESNHRAPGFARFGGRAASHRAHLVLLLQHGSNGMTETDRYRSFSIRHWNPRNVNWRQSRDGFWGLSEMHSWNPADRREILATRMPPRASTGIR